MSWPSARNVLVPVSEAVALGDADGAAAGDEAGAPGDPVAVDDPVAVSDPAGVLVALETVELPDEPQAVTSNAAQASAAPPATCRALGKYVVPMDSHPLTQLQLAALRAMSLIDVRRADMVGPRLADPVMFPVEVRVAAADGTGDT